MSAALDIRSLHVRFALPGGAVVQAVRGVDLVVSQAETVGLVGESGCGKSSLARAAVRLVPVASGRIYVLGRDWTHLSERALRPLRPQAQMVFQDPFSSLNPRMRVGTMLRELLDVHRRGTPQRRAEAVAAILEQVGLHPDDARKFPHQFSGGQRQRIGLARALILEPKLLIADEATSALDVSVQAQVLNLLAELKASRGFAMLFISHDLRVVEQVADRVAVMYLGRIVELGPPEAVLLRPRHPYTQALAAAVPCLDAVRDTAASRVRIQLSGEPPSPLRPPAGCAFAPRCAYATGICHERDPDLDGAPQAVACHHPLHAG